MRWRNPNIRSPPLATEISRGTAADRTSGTSQGWRASRARVIPPMPIAAPARPVSPSTTCQGRNWPPSARPDQPVVEGRGLVGLQLDRAGHVDDLGLGVAGGQLGQDLTVLAAQGGQEPEP